MRNAQKAIVTLLWVIVLAGIPLQTALAAEQVSFTSEEREYIQSCGTIRVGLNAARAPFSEYDSQTGTFSGINEDILAEISKISGLKFTYVPMTAGRTTPELFLSGDYDLICGIEKSNFDHVAAIDASHTYLESAIVPVARRGENISFEDTSRLTVTFPSSFQALKRYIQENYPNYTLRLYNTNRECLEAVRDKKADVFIQNTHIISLLLQEPRYSNMDILPVEVLKEHTAIAVLKTTDPRLLSIVNKSIDSLDSGAISSSLIKHTFANPYHLTFSDFVYKFRWPVAIVSVLVLSCFALLIALLVFRRRSEVQLQTKNLQLSKAVAEAEDSSRAKSQFLARMSHDMHTPLNAVVGLSSEEMLSCVTADQKDELFSKIHTSGLYLLGLIDDILDMSKIDSGKLSLHLSPYSIKEFYDTVYTVIGQQCREKNINFIFDCPVVASQWALVDKVHFNQIFINLLTNAVKFTPPGGTVEFKLEHVSANGRLLKNRFIVRDNGIGMSEDFIPHAFESFSQENREATSGGGSGLGLAIVKQLVELMGGTISLDSAPGKGTTFTVELEAEAVDAPATVSADNGVKIAGLTVLVCEDQPINAQIVKKLLQSKGCKVDLAGDGKIGVDIFQGSPICGYDVILMDMRMPVMNGIEATKAIRALPRSDAKTVPIIAVTANAFDDDIQQAMACGMNAHLPKPIDAKQLFKTIENLTSQAK